MKKVREHKMPSHRSGQDETMFDFIDVFDYPEMVIGSVNFNKTCVMSKYIYNENESVNSILENSMYYSGGMQIRFISDSPKLIIKFCIDEKAIGNYPHVGICNRQGIGVTFRSINNKIWKSYDITAGRDDGSLYVNLGIYLKKFEKYELSISLPILAHISGLSVGIQRGDYTIEPNKELIGKAGVAFLGSYFFYGIGMTSPNSVLSNALSRKLNIPTYNLSINSENYFKYDVTNILAQIQNLDTIIIECDRYSQDYDAFISLFEKYVSDILKNTSCTLILMNQIYTGSYNNKYKERKRYIVNLIAKLNEKYSDRICFVDGEKMLTKQEQEYATYSHNFLNSYATYIVTKALINYLK